MVLIRMIPPRNRSRPSPRVPPEWRKALREYAFEQQRIMGLNPPNDQFTRPCETVTPDTHGQDDTVQNGLTD